MPGHWEGSNRRHALPPDWATRIRPAILDRDRHQCTWLVDLPDGGPHVYLNGRYDPGDRCPAPATDTDHIGDPDNHRRDNLRSLCGWHHNRRSSAQGNAQRWRHREKRPAEQHPGLR